MLQLSPSKDRFTIEASWSRKGRYPEQLIPTQPDQAPRDGELRFRIAWLWRNASLDDAFWVVVGDPPLERPEEWTKPPPPVEELVQKTEGLVDDALERIGQYVLPYFQRILREQGSAGSSIG
jgi:hypothetical protein